MFEDIRIYNADGKLKKIITSKESSKRFWDNYYKSLGKDNSRFEINRKRKRTVVPVDYWEDVNNFWLE